MVAGKCVNAYVYELFCRVLPLRKSKHTRLTCFLNLQHFEVYMINWLYVFKLAKHDITCLNHFFIRRYLQCTVSDVTLFFFHSIPHSHLSAVLCLSVLKIVIAIVGVAASSLPGGITDTAWLFFWQTLEVAVAVITVSMAAIGTRGKYSRINGGPYGILLNIESIAQNQGQESDAQDDGKSDEIVIEFHFKTQSLFMAPCNRLASHMETLKDHLRENHKINILMVLLPYILENMSIF